MGECAADRRWCRWWAAFTAATVTAGVTADVLAYVRGGYPATLTAHIRRWSGQEPHTRWARAGQVGIAVFCGWAGLHLSLGILGPGCRRVTDGAHLSWPGHRGPAPCCSALTVLRRSDRRIHPKSGALDGAHTINTGGSR